MKKICFILCCFVSSHCFSQQQKASIYFDFNKSELTPNAVKTLDSILSAGSLASISLSGNCDAIGNDAYNDLLSLKRIAAAKKYLLKKGIATNVFTAAKGLGKRKPINDNSTEENRLYNRRVDVLFSSGKDKNSLEYKMKSGAVKAGDNIGLKNLFFIGGRHTLVPGADTVLKELLQTMLNYPSLKIELQGHICCLFDVADGLDYDSFTNELSLNRAKAVYDYLVKNGIDKERLSYKGFGGSKPLVYPEKTEQDEDMNRRVEIKIIAK